MGQNRLSTLVLMHINLDIDIDVKRVLKIFCNRDGALEFINICASEYSVMQFCSNFSDSFDLIHSVSNMHQF